MKKLILIGLKDLKLMFRDRAALIFMLLAPFLLTIGMGFVTGRFSGGSTGISDIPVVIVNLDKQDLGNALEELLFSKDLEDLLNPTLTDDPDAARLAIDSNEASAAIIIPDGFTLSITSADNSIFDPTSVQPPSLQVEVYTNPSSPTSAGIIKSIVDEFISQVEEERTRIITSIIQLISSGLLSPLEVENELTALNQNKDQSESNAIKLKTEKGVSEDIEFDLLAYFAPGMALMFLMFTVSYGGRSILGERAQGTLLRLMISPTNNAQILGGKVLGIFFMGVAQMSILILASYIFFQVRWGDFIGITVLICAAVFGATGWGLLITSFARTPAQVGSVGTAIMLIFGILGGSFINLEQMPSFVQIFSKITPNAWGLDGFTTLALGGTLKNLTEPIIALITMGIVLFGISVLLFNRNGLVQK
ncbi:ABC transporter permease [Chloroflexota bacterium]